MINLFRKIVAGPKNRTVQGQYDLDLTHITDRIIAMAFPASGIEKTYRNSIDDVASYLNKQYKGHYMVFNMSMRKYDYEKFQNRVNDYFWPDHQAPPLSILFCAMRDMYEYLSQDEKNVIVVHCNHGKGRTGTAIISFFLFTKLYKNPKKAQAYYNKKRFSTNTYGVDQPCQMRYLGYVSETLINQQEIPSRLKSYRLANFRQVGLGEDYFLRITSVRSNEKKYDALYFPLKYKPANVPVMADVLIQIFEPSIMGSKQLCRINYNLHFLPVAHKQGNEKQLITVEFKSQGIKVNNKNIAEFKFQLDFALYCQCHKISQKDQLNINCGCFLDRKVQDKAWQSVKIIAKQSQKITQSQAIKLVFGHLDETQLKIMGEE